MEDLKTDLIKFLQEILTNDERVVKETHDENKIMATSKHTTHNYKDGSVVVPSLPQPIRLTP